PYVYARNVPERSGWADRVLILDPMLATGGSAAATVEIVRQSHQGELDVLCMVAAPSASRPSSKPTTGSAWSRWPSTITSTSKASSFLALATLATATSARSAWK